MIKQEIQLNNKEISLLAKLLKQERRVNLSLGVDEDLRTCNILLKKLVSIYDCETT